MLGGAILLILERSPCDPYRVCWWNANRFFLVLCAIMKLCRELGLFRTILCFGSLISFCVFQWISHSLMYLSVDILQVLIYSFRMFSSLGFSLSIGVGSWKSWACILTSCSFFGLLSFFDPIYKWNSTKSQFGWDVHEIYLHIYIYCPMYWCF